MEFYVQFIYIFYGPRETVSHQRHAYNRRVTNVMKLRILHRNHDGGFTMGNVYYNLNVMLKKCNNNNCRTIVGLGNILGSLCEKHHLE